MTILLSQGDYHDLFEEAEQNGEIACQSNEFETIWGHPKQLGQGYYQVIKLRPGLSLSISDYLIRDHLLIKSFDREHIVELGFLLLGNCRWDNWGDFTSGQNFLFGSGICPGGVGEHPAGQRILQLNIEMYPQLLETFVAGHSEALPEVLKPLVKDANELTYFCSGTTTPAMQIVLQQILCCPYRGITKRMYLESKVMELMALRLAQLLENDEKFSSSVRLKRDDIDRIHQAKKLLVQNLDNPPSVLELARWVGLNRRKLNEGFRQVLGTTPFGYLRDHRLELARQLLINSETPVEEIALAIGYVNRGNFAAAFRKKFGMNPKAYQLQGRTSRV